MTERGAGVARSRGACVVSSIPKFILDTRVPIQYYRIRPVAVFRRKHSGRLTFNSCTDRPRARRDSEGGGVTNQ
jgi:hypothetical protein